MLHAKFQSPSIYIDRYFQLSDSLSYSVTQSGTEWDVELCTWPEARGTAKNSSPCQWKCPDLSIFGCPYYVVQLAQRSAYIMIVKSTLTADAESFCPKINLNTKLHVFASIWNSFEVNWLSLKNFTAILACPIWEIFGDSNVDFFQFQGLKIKVNQEVSTKNQSTFKATCVSFHLKPFSGQLVKFKRFYSNFSDFNSRFLRIPGWENFIILS